MSPYRTPASPLDKTEERYHNDPAFHALVDFLEDQIERLELAPSEIREAAMYACFRRQMRNLSPVFKTGDLSDEDKATLERLFR